MKTILLIVALLALSPAQGGGTEQAILKLEGEWVEALLKADTAALERLYADDLSYTHSNGAVDTKASYLTLIREKKTVYESIDRDEIKVSVYGDAAVVTCHVVFKVKLSGQPSVINGRFIHVYAKPRGRWQMVAHQSTRLVQP
ncbi:MAG TPA: nuclear transport factor 2 family protein [Blastocatellia bacterium]|jgi:ketosteroid isomerase-like protein|nr:nuclear transport factor 2 family protein [Blastocatellia bacterium]